MNIKEKKNLCNIMKNLKRNLRKKSKSNGIMKKVKRLINKQIETNYINTNFTATSITNAGSLVPVLQVPQSISGGRKGFTIQPQACTFRYSIQGGDATNIVRVILMWSKVQLTTAFLPQNPNTVISPVQQNYKVLYDRTHRVGTVESTTLPEIVGPTRNVRRWIGGNQRYSSGLASSVTAGFLNLWLISDSAFPANPTITGTFQVSFQDA